MASSGILRRVALIRADVSEELSVFIITVTKIGELGTLAVTSNRCTLLSLAVARVVEACGTETYVTEALVVEACGTEARVAVARVAEARVALRKAPALNCCEVSEFSN
jgi:hypothetical protein